MPPPIYLASRSPRRQQLLAEAGLSHSVIASGIDDGELVPRSHDPVSWVMGLAYLKARGGREGLGGMADALVIGADTVCVLDGRIIGQPENREHAGSIIRSFVGRSHEVLTGVCFLCARLAKRDLFAVRATVTLGGLDERLIEAYLETGLWRGKAGAYNYDERLADGWPLSCVGDTSAVTGLPMTEFSRRLAAWCEESPEDGER